MFANENNYDGHFEKASAEVGIPTYALKALCAAISKFDPGYAESGRFGLAGLTLDVAGPVANAKWGSYPDPRDLRDCEINIRLAAHALRTHLGLNNNNLGEATVHYADHVGFINKRNEEARKRFVDAWWKAYMYFSQKSGEPPSYKPAEVEGVYVYKGGIKYL